MDETTETQVILSPSSSTKSTKSNDPDTVLQKRKKGWPTNSYIRAFLSKSGHFWRESSHFRPKSCRFRSKSNQICPKFSTAIFRDKNVGFLNWYRIFDLRKSPYLNFFQGPLKIISDATQPNFEVWNGDWNLKFCICIGITIKGTHQGLNLEY